MSQQPNDPTFGCFNIHEIARSFPESSDSLLLDTYLTRDAAASARVLRFYQGTPPHFHADCDEFLFVLSGKGTFWMGDPSQARAFAPGMLLFFKRGTPHALPAIHEGPVVFLSIDTPQRVAGDVHFLNAEDGTPDSFIQPLKAS